MQILSLSVKNFKIYNDRFFEFQPGFNAICGENGAGKTSILEAIAWVLFNYMGEYTKDELRRQGTNSMEAIVSFISALDGRTYRVQRQSGKSRAGNYIIFDPQLDLKIEGIHKLEDAMAWLQQHLGLPVNTNLPPAKYLPKLFGEVIGIPQGTFAIDFLKTARERKEIFDPILQVEDYKQAFKNSAEVESLAKLEVQRLADQVQHYHDRLADWDSLRQELTIAEGQWQQEQEQLVQLQQQVTEKEQTWLELRQQGEALHALNQSLEQCHSQIQQHHQQYQFVQDSYQRSQAAVAICNQERSAYETYLTAQKELQQLQQQRHHRDQLVQKRSALEQDLQRYHLHQAKIQVQREQLATFRQELNALTTSLQAQEALEEQLQNLREQLEQLKRLAVQHQDGQRRQAALQQQLQQIIGEIERLEALETIAAGVGELESQRQRLQQHIAHRQAAQQFYDELQHLVSQGQQGQTEYHQTILKARDVLGSLREALPLFLEPLQDIENTLEWGWQLQHQQLEALEQIVQDLSPQLQEAELKKQLKTIEQQHKAAQQAQLHRAQLPLLQQQEQQCHQELETTIAQAQQWQIALQRQTPLQQEYESCHSQLKDLGDPRSRQQFLQQQLQQEPQLDQQQLQFEQSITDLQICLETIVLELEPYASLDMTVQHHSEQCQKLEPNYRRYVQQEPLAQELPQQEATLQHIQHRLTELNTDYKQQYDRYVQQQQTYSPETLKAAENTYHTLRSQRDYLEGSLGGKANHLQRLKQDLAQRQGWQDECDRLQREYEQKQNVYQFLKDARAIYNQAGPRITRYYLEEICLEADRLFRELMNRPGMALKWTEDYEIQVQEDSTWRNFRTLSGGEQTAAALAVRLALLKVLAELDVAFFDEPTTNLDHDRREQLADALSHLKSFRQLFVISHDDTFEHLTENIIRVERLPMQ